MASNYGMSSGSKMKTGGMKNKMGGGSSGCCGTQYSPPAIAGNTGSTQWAPTPAAPIPQRKRMGGIA